MGRMNELHEINQYSDKLFPFGIYKINQEGSIPEGRGFDSIHWHEELQFTVVATGSIRMEVNGKSQQLNQGEGVFINSGALHQMTALEANSSYLSFNFFKEIISFNQNSRLDIAYVRPYTQLFSFSEIFLTKDSPWKRVILRKLEDVYNVFFGERSFGWEYQISILLSEIWLLVIQNGRENEKTSSSSKKIERIERIQQMLSFVHEHYQETVTLDSIALSANVSVAECSRLFQEFVKKSPYKYLLDYRIERSTDFLKSESYSVTEVSQLVGFNQVAHFIQLFKKNHQLTPKKYQLRYLESQKRTLNDA